MTQAASAVALALLLGVGLVSADPPTPSAPSATPAKGSEPAAAPKTEPKKDDTKNPERTPGADGARPEGGRPDGGRPEGGRGEPGGRERRMPMSPEMVDKVLAVAKDVSPELAEKLNALREGPSEQLPEAVRQNARRLISLAFLKERNEELYKVRVKDLRVQLELHALGVRYDAAKSAGNKAELEALDVEIAKKVAYQVALDHNARAQELVALDAQMKDMREDLERDLKPEEVKARVEERISAVKLGQPIKGRPGPGEGRPPQQGSDKPAGDSPSADKPAARKQ